MNNSITQDNKIEPTFPATIVNAALGIFRDKVSQGILLALLILGFVDQPQSNTSGKAGGLFL
jgi:hypothetical protein